MKALSLWQPWASLVAKGVKTIETRSWRPPPALIGERIAIHAAQRVPTGDEILLLNQLTPTVDTIPLCWTTKSGDLPLGAVLATARLAGDHPADLVVFDRSPNSEWIVLESMDSTIVKSGVGNRPLGDFRRGRWAWLLSDIVELDEPVPATGHQRIWEWAS